MGKFCDAAPVGRRQGGPGRGGQKHKTRGAAGSRPHASAQRHRVRQLTRAVEREGPFLFLYKVLTL